MKIESASTSKTTRVGSIDRKSTTYDVWSLGEDGAESVGGDELLGLAQAVQVVGEAAAGLGVLDAGSGAICHGEEWVGDRQ